MMDRSLIKKRVISGNPADPSKTTLYSPNVLAVFIISKTYPVII